MTDTPAGPEPAHSAFRVLAALADLGAANAAAIAERAGLGYSTVTPKLRAWESSGHAEKYRQAHTNLVLWRLTAAGRAATSVETKATALQADTEPPDPAASDDRITDAAGPSPAETTPSDGAPTEHDAAPHHAGNDCRPDDEQPAPDVATAQPTQIPSVTDADRQPAEAADHSDDTAMPDDGDSAATPRPAAKRKRPAGALEASVQAILDSHPDEKFKVNDLRKLVDQADEGTGYPAASAGAISNALTKLTGKGAVDTVEEKPATFQAAPTNGRPATPHRTR